MDAAFILTGLRAPWTLEVAFHDQKQFLGFDDPQQQTARAVARTAPLAGLVYGLVLLWAAGQGQQGGAAGWVSRPWYRTKTAPSFLDLLTALRQASGPTPFSPAPSAHGAHKIPPRRYQPPTPRRIMAQVEPSGESFKLESTDYDRTPGMDKSSWAARTIDRRGGACYHPHRETLPRACPAPGHALRRGRRRR